VKERRRYVLHVDLDPFFVSVERSLDSALRGRALVIGGDGRGHGFVAAASEEARAAGVRPGLPLEQARQLAPEAEFRRGDLDAYGRVSEEVTAVLLAASRRVERPSADEAFVDLSPETSHLGHGQVAPVRAAEQIRDELQRRLGLDASLGLASSRLAARVASGWAKPRGLLVVLPGYERSFVGPKPLALLDLPPSVEAALGRAGLTTLGSLAEADPAALAEAVGPLAPSLVAAARGEGEPEIALAAPPSFLQEEATVRDRKGDALALVEIADSLARRAARRLKPFRLGAGAVAIEVRGAGDSLRRAVTLADPSDDAERLAAHARALAEPLVDHARGVRALQLRLSRLGPAGRQAPLFPATPAFRRAL
jgi:nucleotidyltransferase/DNA polymerase involved in DNA repair